MASYEVLKCGEWTYLFATNVANKKILFDIAALNEPQIKVLYVLLKAYHGSKIHFYLNIFLSEYCVQKCLV